MAERVVHFLEAVEVDEQHRRLTEDRVAGVLLDRLDERGAVHEAGQRVVPGLVAQLALQGALVMTSWTLPTIVPSVRSVDGHLDHPDRAVVVAQFHLGGERAARVPDRAGVRLGGRPVTAHDEVGHRHADALVRRVPEQRRNRGADVDDCEALGIEHRDHVLRVCWTSSRKYSRSVVMVSFACSAHLVVVPML